MTNDLPPSVDHLRGPGRLSANESVLTAEIARYHHDRRSSARIGKLIITALYAAYLGLYLWIYLATPLRLKPELAASLSGAFLWTTGLFGAIVYRQKWARYVTSAMTAVMLIAFYLLSSDVSYVLQANSDPRANALWWAMVTAALLVIATVWATVFSRDVRRLTSSRGT